LTTLRGYAFGDAAYDVDIRMPSTATSLTYAVVDIAKAAPGDSATASGYSILLDAQGQVALWKGGWPGAGSGYLVGATPTGTSPRQGYVHLRVVQSASSIAVWVGNGDSQPEISYRDPVAPFMGGSVSLGASGSPGVQFRGFTATDNLTSVPLPGAPFDLSDWRANGGSWNLVPSVGGMRNSAATGQLNLMMRRPDTPGSTSLFTTPWTAGDGTYHVTVQLSSQSGDPTAWAGLNFVGNDASGAGNTHWSTAGYLVFLRRNGNLGLYKGGTGQIVPDVPTGKNPTLAPVGLRIVKRGSALKVYVDGVHQPLIDLQDDSGNLDREIGNVGLATYGSTATFTQFSYAADNPAP
jgi:hypothetical protein